MASIVSHACALSPRLRLRDRLLDGPRQVHRLAPFGSIACPHLCPLYRWSGLGGVRFKIEPTLPSERARLCREGGTHDKSPKSSDNDKAISSRNEAALVTWRQHERANRAEDSL